MVDIKRLLHEANSFVKECKKGFEAISKTGNPRVADVFLEELNKELNDIQQVYHLYTPLITLCVVLGYCNMWRSKVVA